jgi:Fe-S-cluster-containing dehydrogenase component
MVGEGEEKADRVTFDTERCTGCRSCELACSFHHTSAFQPRVSSIEIANNPGKTGFLATFFREEFEDHKACDRCQGLPGPLCVPVCPKRSHDELENLVKKI